MTDSLEFLTNHFNSYSPKHAYIYIVFLVVLENRHVLNRNELYYEINEIIDNLTKNNANLIFDFALDINKIDYISRLKINFNRIFFSGIIKDMVLEELLKMNQYQSDEDKKEQFDLLKYYFPYKINFLSFDNSRPFNYSNPLIYYFLRKQLVLCKTKQEMIEKLKYDEQFKSYIIQEFYSDDKDIINKKEFEKRVYLVFNDLIQGLNMDKKKLKNTFYEDFNIYSNFIKQKFGI